MQRLLVTTIAASMLLVLPAAAEADVKRFTVTVKSTPHDLVIETCEGQPTGAGGIRLTGTVTPARADTYVRIYKKLYGKPWKIEGTTRVRSSGRFAFVDKPTTKTVRQYKVRMPTVGSYRLAYSEPIRVWVGKDSCPD